jgi:[ribosomal protein S18]-alanine N-acetyltransferase
VYYCRPRSPKKWGVDMQLRKMLRADISRVMEIEAQCFEDPWSLDIMAGELTNPISSSLVLEEDGQILGFVVFWMVSDEFHLLDVAVCDEAKGRGLGRLLVSEAMDQGLKRALRYAILEVRESNSQALGLYRSLGFEVVGRRTKYYVNNGEDALMMQVYFAGSSAE